MNMLRRHIGRRVAGVGVGVALLVLGLEAPAFAAPAVTAFTPTTGPTDCVVVITGTGFLDVPQAQQDLIFVGPVAGSGDDVSVPDAEWARISATEIWTEVPGTLALGTSYTVQVTDPTGGTASTGTFLRSSGTGACAPTITTVTPSCGVASDKVKIDGTNLIGPGLVGGETRFSPYDTARIAAHAVPDVDEPTSISVVVPSGSTDGKIQVTTFDTDTVTAGVQGGIAFSPTVFDISDACPQAAGHARSISLKLKDKLVAKGTVKSTETTPFTDCAASVPVKIQRKVSGSWKTVGKTTTSDTGAYSKKIKNKKGKYRSIAVKTTLEGGEVCLKAKSPVRTH
jgi:hypothetical protein